MLRLKANDAIKRNGVLPPKGYGSLRPPLQEKNMRVECTDGDCDKTFTKKQNMRLHFRSVHCGERFPCSFENCGQTFSYKHNMLSHIKAVHDGERPYPGNVACTFNDCFQVFTKKQVMLRHVRTVHQGIRDVACTLDGCHQVFMTQQVMLRHVRTVHQGIRDVACTFDGCHQVFSTKQHLEGHYACWHTKEGMQRKVKKQDRLRLLLEEKYAVDSECTIRYLGGCLPDPDRFCSRVDFHVVGIPHVTVIVENDEEGHRAYGLTCELSRMEQIHEAIMKAHEQDSGESTPCKPVLFVRYNCDSYTVDGVKRKTRQKDRDAKLMGFLETVLKEKRFYYEPINVVYICYDSTGGDADVMSDPEYYPQMKACVRESIY